MDFVGASETTLERGYALMQKYVEHPEGGSPLGELGGKVMRRLSGNDPEVNEEWITDKDRFAFHYATESDRLTYPQVRDRVEDGGDGRLYIGSLTAPRAGVFVIP